MNGAHFALASVIAQNKQTTLAWQLWTLNLHG